MFRNPIIPILPLALVAACGEGTAPTPPEATSWVTSSTPPGVAPTASTVTANAETVPVYHGGALVRSEWAKADNRRHCAPVAFTETGDAGGIARAAVFGGGWAVAFDLPEQRSAYGVAGPGLLQADDGPPYAQVRRLARQWPYDRDLEGLSGPSFSGYGLVGAKPYRAENPSGAGDHSLAYVRIYGQKCTYNVWSRIGRAHLETLLDGLRLLPPGG